MTISKCEKCFHKKVCIKGANHKEAEKCGQYVLENDVQEVRHGKWMPSHPVKVAKEWKCSVCNGLITLPVFALKCYYDYCPNCGAKMDGEEK